MTYLRARYYAPTVGRFFQPDSFVPDALSPQKWNLYHYTTNNPIRYVDPSGHDPQCLFGPQLEVDANGNEVDLCEQIPQTPGIPSTPPTNTYHQLDAIGQMFGGYSPFVTDLFFQQTQAAAQGLAQYNQYVLNGLQLIPGMDMAINGTEALTGHSLATMQPLENHQDAIFNAGMSWGGGEIIGRGVNYVGGKVYQAAKPYVAAGVKRAKTAIQSAGESLAKKLLGNTNLDTILFEKSLGKITGFFDNEQEARQVLAEIARECGIKGLVEYALYPPEVIEALRKATKEAGGKTLILRKWHEDAWAANVAHTLYSKAEKVKGAIEIGREGPFILAKLPEEYRKRYGGHEFVVMIGDIDVGAILDAKGVPIGEYTNIYRKFQTEGNSMLNTLLKRPSDAGQVLLEHGPLSEGFLKPNVVKALHDNDGGLPRIYKLLMGDVVSVDVDTGQATLTKYYQAVKNQGLIDFSEVPTLSQHKRLWSYEEFVNACEGIGVIKLDCTTLVPKK